MNITNISSIDELGAIFAESLAEVISKISGFSLGVLSSDHDPDFAGMVGVMNLNSKKRGMIFISSGEYNMRVLCSFMTGVPKNEVTKEDIHDALCELVNMTAGNAKLRISDEDYMFTLSSPFIIDGENMSIITKKRVHVVSNILGDGEIFIKLKIVY